MPARCVTLRDVEIHETVTGFRTALDSARSDRRTIGLVPTMGYLHDGHVSLMRTAAERCDLVALTIFVNPLQFAANEDLSTYPRDLERDLAAARDAGVDVVFTPDESQMYPSEPLTTVAVSRLSSVLEGRSRPTHFTGVTTVVAKLFNIAGPCSAFFGEKDFQQLAVVSRMVTDLNFPVRIVGCPIVREPDGIAMSSRNVYLTDAERAAAPVLFRALRSGADLVDAGERDPAVVRELMRTIIATEPLADLDYAEVVDAETLEIPEVLAGRLRLLVAARFGIPRLLDNLGVHAPV